MSVPLRAPQVAPASHRYSGFWEVLGRLREWEVLWLEAADPGLSRTVYRLHPAASLCDWGPLKLCGVQPCATWVVALSTAQWLEAVRDS